MALKRVEPSSLGWAHRLTLIAKERGDEPTKVFFDYWDQFMAGDDDAPTTSTPDD